MTARGAVVLLGPPGVGKGTQAAALAAAFRLRPVSSGVLLRAEVAAGTARVGGVAGCIARGDLVPDALVADLVADAIARFAGGRGIVLEGFPKTRAQAVRADRALAAVGARVVVAVELRCPLGELRARLRRRALAEGRLDDDPATVERRLAAFATTPPDLLDHYAAAGLLESVDAARPVGEVTAALAAVVRHRSPVPS